MKKLTEKLQALGMAWETTNKRFTCTRACCRGNNGAAYHILVDADDERPQTIRVFETLEAVELYLERAADQEREWEEEVARLEKERA